MITSLALSNFKNYKNVNAQFAPGINFFVGLNGAGKTNLLDAIHYLCVTRSFVNPQDRYIVMHDQEFFRLSGTVHRLGKDHQVVAKVRPGTTKELLVDENKVERLADHIGFIPVIILSPKDHILVGGTSADRRKFLDFYLCQTDHAYLLDLATYNRLLSQRNALLKDQGFEADQQLLDAFTAKMEGPNGRIAQKRNTFIAMLRPSVQSLYAEISDHRDTIQLAYHSDFTDWTLAEVCATANQRDRALGRTTRGIHRDEVLFDLSEHPVKRFGSQGQMKSYLIGLHLSLYNYLRDKTGVAPVLLMDDIFDKLDDQRVEHLVRILTAKGYEQVFITDARADRVLDVCRLLNLPANVLHVANGEIDGNQVSLENETLVLDDQEE